MTYKINRPLDGKKGAQEHPLARATRKAKESAKKPRKKAAKKASPDKEE